MTDQHITSLLQYMVGRRSGLHGLAWLVRKSVRGLLAACLARRTTTGTAGDCDVLIIHPSAKSRAQGRKNELIHELKKRNLEVRETTAISDQKILMRREMLHPGERVPPALFLPASRARYLLSRFRARVIITERNGWMASSFLRRYREKSTRTLHLAHGILTSEYDFYGYHDYDYYAVFGQSSVDYLRSIAPGLGETRAVLTGPYFPLPARHSPSPESRTILFLGAGPDTEKTDGYQATCRLAMAWLEQNPSYQLRLRLHPRGTGFPWTEWARENDRLSIQEPGNTLGQDLNNVAVVWSAYTNAIIDCAVAGVPVMVLGDDPDYFQCDRFAIPRISDNIALDKAMASLEADSSGWHDRLSGFAHYHIEQAGNFPLHHLAGIIEGLARGHEPESFFTIH